MKVDNEHERYVREKAVGALISGLVFSVQPSHADVVTDWNMTGMDASAQTNVLVQSRGLESAQNGVGHRQRLILRQVRELEAQRMGDQLQ
jgi:hypothetical protein